MSNTMMKMVTVEYTRKGIIYELECDVEEEDFGIQTVTQLNGPQPEHELDPDIFAGDLDDSEWDAIGLLIDEAIE